MRSIPCLPMNGRKSMSDIRDMMAATLVTMLSVLLVLLYDCLLCGYMQNRYDDSTVLW